MKSALVIGASRGIGRQVAITLSRNGYSVGVAAKTEVSQDSLPGTIHDVVSDITKEGGFAIPIKCNARKSTDIEDAVKKCIKKYVNLFKIDKKQYLHFWIFFLSSFPNLVNAIGVELQFQSTDTFFYKKKFNVTPVVWFYRDKCLCFSHTNYSSLFNIDFM